MMIASLCRRALLGVSLGALATLSSLPASADQITFVSQGGAYQKAQTIAILDPAAKKLGITVNQDSIPDAWPAIKSQVASGKPTWDVVDVPTGYCLRGGEQGLLEKLDFSKLPNGLRCPRPIVLPILWRTSSIPACSPIVRRNFQRRQRPTAGPISGT